MKESRHEYVDLTIEGVLRDYANGYKTKDEAEVITGREWFIDPFKKEVLFRIITSVREMRMEVAIDSVMWAYAKNRWNFQGVSEPGILRSDDKDEQVLDVKWFIDPMRNVVSFRLLVAPTP